MAAEGSQTSVLSKHQEIEYRKMFVAMDTDKDAKLSAAELVTGLRAMCMTPTEADAHLIQQDITENCTSLKRASIELRGDILRQWEFSRFRNKWKCVCTMLKLQWWVFIYLREPVNLSISNQNVPQSEWAPVIYRKTEKTCEMNRREILTNRFFADSGLVDFDEFCMYALRFVPADDPEIALRRAFRTWDKELSGACLGRRKKSSINPTWIWTA